MKNNGRGKGEIKLDGGQPRMPVQFASTNNYLLRNQMSFHTKQAGQLSLYGRRQEAGQLSIRQGSHQAGHFSLGLPAYQLPLSQQAGQLSLHQAAGSQGEERHYHKAVLLNDHQNSSSANLFSGQASQELDGDGQDQMNASQRVMPATGYAYHQFPSRTGSNGVAVQQQNAVAGVCNSFQQMSASYGVAESPALVSQTQELSAGYEMPAAPVFKAAAAADSLHQHLSAVSQFEPEGQLSQPVGGPAHSSAQQTSGVYASFQPSETVCGMVAAADENIIPTCSLTNEKKRKLSPVSRMNQEVPLKYPSQREETRTFSEILISLKEKIEYCRSVIPAHARELYTGTTAELGKLLQEHKVKVGPLTEGPKHQMVLLEESLKEMQEENSEIMGTLSRILQKTETVERLVAEIQLKQAALVGSLGCDEAGRGKTMKNIEEVQHQMRALVERKMSHLFHQPHQEMMESSDSPDQTDGMRKRARFSRSSLSGNHRKLFDDEE